MSRKDGPGPMLENEQACTLLPTEQEFQELISEIPDLDSSLV